MSGPGRQQEPVCARCCGAFSRLAGGSSTARRCTAGQKRSPAICWPEWRERPHAFLATKVWTTGFGRGIEQMERSAELLRTKTIDLMQIHNLVDL
jgi:hypothetical protein